MLFTLGVKDITTDRQRMNGTIEWELPIKKMYSSQTTYAIRYASYKSGYMRNTSPSNTSCWQINKKFVSRNLRWSSYSKKYFESESHDRVLVDNEDDRVVYIVNYILRNNYNGNDLFSIDKCNQDDIEQMYYEVHNNVLVSKDTWARYKELDRNESSFGDKAALRVCNNLLDEEILRGLDQRARIQLQVESLFNLRKEVKALKSQVKGENCKCTSLYAPDVSITINGVKYTEDEN